MRLWVCTGLAVTALAAPSLLSAQAPMDGVWNNIDAQTGGVVQLLIQGRRVHPYGQCHPELCGWGATKGKLTDDASRLTATQTDRVGRRQMTLVLGPDGLLHMRVSTVYPDGRFGPGEHTEEYIFRRAGAAPAR